MEALIDNAGAVIARNVVTEYSKVPKYKLLTLHTRLFGGREEGHENKA
jgi:hypothetical protein